MPAPNPAGAVADFFKKLRTELDALGAGDLLTPLRELSKTFKDVRADLEQAGADIGKSMRPLTAVFQNLGKSMAGVQKGVEAFLKPFKDLAAAIDSCLAPLRAAKAAFDTVTAPVRLAVSTTAQFARTVVGLPGAMAGAAAGMAAKVSGALAGPTSQIQAFFGRVQGVLGSLVQNVDPAAVLRFNLALSDLYAVLGSALRPALDQFTQLARSLGAALNGMTSEGKMMVAGLAAGAVGMALFSAAAAALSAALTGGIAPLLGAVAGALGGVTFATGGFRDALKPLSETFAGVFNRLGSVMAAFAGSPAFAQIAVALGDMTGQLVEVGASVLEGIMPAFGVLVEVFRALVPAVAPFVLVVQGPMIVGLTMLGKVIEATGPLLLILADNLTAFGKVVWDFSRQFLSLFGVNLPEFGKAPRSESKDNTGMAVRQTSTTGVQDVLRLARERAFSGSVGAAKKTDWAEKTSSGIDSLNTEVQAIKDIINKLTPESVAAALANLVQNQGRKAARQITEPIDRAAASPTGRVVGNLISPVGMAALDGLRALREKYG